MREFLQVIMVIVVGLPIIFLINWVFSDWGAVAKGAVIGALAGLILFPLNNKLFKGKPLIGFAHK
jgi:hypothetical protein